MYQDQNLIESVIDRDRFPGPRAARAQRARHSLAESAAKHPADPGA